MLKYTDSQVTFSEVPDEISLCINISNCPNNCIGCHSSYLKNDIGTLLSKEELDSLIKANEGISAVCIMGGDSEPKEVDNIAKFIKDKYGLKTAWYSGNTELSKDINISNFDFIKIGPYDRDKGPLNNPNTNQKFYEVVTMSTGKQKLHDITFKFWRK